MEFYEILSSAGIGSLATIAFLWIVRNWIREHLIYSVRYQYEASLRKLEDALKRKTDEFLIHLEGQLHKDIELAKLRLGPYSTQQYAAYSALWLDLIDLNSALNDLSKKAAKEQFAHFDAQLGEFRTNIRKTALLIESRHYHALNDIIKDCIAVQTGREMTQALYSEGSTDESLSRRQLVNEAAQTTEIMKVLQSKINDLLEDMRKHIQGEQ